MKAGADYSLVDHHANKVKDYVQRALDKSEPLTPEQWLQGAQVHATLALARATERSSHAAE